jgi:hypothetical protein
MDPGESGLDEMISMLEERMTMEIDLSALRERIYHCSADKKAFVEIVKLMPCILHLEIRVGIKTVDTILTEGLNGCMTKAEDQKFMSEVEDLVNSKHVLGGSKIKANWKFPCELCKKTGEPSRYVIGENQLKNG